MKKAVSPTRQENEEVGQSAIKNRVNAIDVSSLFKLLAKYSEDPKLLLDS